MSLLRRISRVCLDIPATPRRHLCLAGGGGDKRDGESDNDGGKAAPDADDPFDLGDFVTGDDVDREDADARAAALLAEQERALQGVEVTPELASEVVSRMVAAASQSLSTRAASTGKPSGDPQQQHQDSQAGGLEKGLEAGGQESTLTSTPQAPSFMGTRNVLHAITPHTIEVLRAARISTNKITAALSEIHIYPVERRVTGELLLDRLELSRAARAALCYLAGPRLYPANPPVAYRNGHLVPKFARPAPTSTARGFDKVQPPATRAEAVDGEGAFVRVSCDLYPTKAENRALVVTRLHRLVKEAKLAVGEQVDETPLAEWQTIAAEVNKQADIELEEAGSDLNRVLGLLPQQVQQDQQQQQQDQQKQSG